MLKSTLIRGGTCVAFVVALLACFGLETLWASSSAVEGGLVVRRSTRAAPHRLIVHPNGATVAADQTQHFGVTDPQGRPVEVRWNVSGLGCSGSSCGTINDQGVYQPPSSLPQPRVVTVEGVLVSDPNYSVLTEVRLESALVAKAVPNSAAASSQNTQAFAAPLIAPTVERQNLAGRAELPLPNAVAAAPIVGRQSVVRSAELPPLQGAITPAPMVEKRNVASRVDLPPLPNAVGAPPTVGRQSAARSLQSLPLPVVIGAAPVVSAQSIARTSEPLPLPVVIGAAPVVGSQSVVRGGKLPPLPNAIGAAPTFTKQSAARSSEPLPLAIVIGAAPEVGKQSIVRSGQLPPVPNAIGAAPVVAGQSIAHSGQLPLPNAVAAAPLVTDRNATRDAGGRAAPELIAVAKPPARMFPEETHQLPSAPIRQNPAARVVLPPMQDVAAAATGAAAGSTPHAPVVTYSDGQLTINAENITLAAVLQLIAEKTGALIEVPPGTGLERIFEHTGPGRAEDVLASLLNGSSFDFVIVGSPQRPHVPTQVLLTLHGTDDTVASVPSQPSRPTAPATSWTPPDAGPAIVVPQELDSKNLEPPKEPLSGDALDKLMKDRTKQLRERLQEQQQQQ